MKTTSSQLKVLSIDIGGSHVKATVLDKAGVMLVDYKKVETPLPANPENIIKAIQTLAQIHIDYNKISVGFPGYVRDGIVKTAPNLDNDAWANFNLAEKLEQVLGKPARVVNDADMAGLGVIKGEGLELVITLGTGYGTALLLNGQLLPHLEVGQSPATKTKTYDKFIGEKAFEKDGQQKWNVKLKKVLQNMKTLFNYDHLYIGGGNAREINFKLEENMTVVTNRDGIKGGSRLWADEIKPSAAAIASTIKKSPKNH